jgi:hypothetical protein
MTKLIERRSAGRTMVSKGGAAVLWCPTRLYSPANLSVLPPNFALSFDNFRSVRKCRLIWRRDDFTGIAFEN